MKKPDVMDPKSKARKAHARPADRPAMKPEGDSAPRRVDRPAFKRGGPVKGKGSTVNIVIAPQGGQGAPPPMPMPMPAGGPCPVPGPALPPRGLGAVPPPGAAGPGPGFARGGHVMAGAGTGVARLAALHRR